jgi:hypothetical protein
MIRTKIKWLDPVTQDALLFCFVPVLGITYLKTQNKAYLFFTILLMIIAVVYAMYIVKSGDGLLLENSFTGKVKIKPEEGCMPDELQQLPARADGINTGIHPGKVYKLRSGTNVYIDSSGEVRCYSLFSTWVNPGWITKDKVGNDECWHALF